MISMAHRRDAVYQHRAGVPIGPDNAVFDLGIHAAIGAGGFVSLHARRIGFVGEEGGLIREQHIG